MQQRSCKLLLSPGTRPAGKYLIEIEIQIEIEIGSESDGSIAPIAFQ
jgi:hypothetical protein